MNEAQSVIRVVVLALYVVTLLLCGAAGVKQPERRLWAVVPMTLALHTILFYAVLISAAPVRPEVFNLWSGALRIHEGVLVLSGCWLFLWPARGRT